MTAGTDGFDRDRFTNCISSRLVVSRSVSHSTGQNLKQSGLRQSWEIDEQPPIKNLSDAERSSEQPVRVQTQRTSEGRSNVAFDDRLPSLRASKTLETKRIALRNLRSQRDQQLEL
jgi:hypothetical protein